MNTAICSSDYKVIREEPHNISEGQCLLDLMANIQEETAEGEKIIFILTQEAIRCMCCSYDSGKELRYFKHLSNNRQGVGVWWLPTDPLQKVSEEAQKWMRMWTTDRCKTYFVEEVHTEKIQYKYPQKGSEVVQHVIG